MKANRTATITKKAINLLARALGLAAIKLSVAVQALVRLTANMKALPTKVVSTQAKMALISL